MKYSLVQSLVLAASVVVAYPTTTQLDIAEENIPVVNLQWDTTPGWNDRIVNAGGCKPITVIFARGTMEPPPVPGLLTGYPFVQALKKKYKADMIDVQGVTYGAGIMGYLEGGDQKGADTMAQMIKSEIKACPNTSLLVGGYSQGGQVVHKAAKQLTAAEAKHIKAVVIFGDPDKGSDLPNISPKIVDTVCDPNDMICKHLPLPIGSHLTYSTKAGAAADWVFNTLGPNGKGKSGGSSSSSSSKPKTSKKPKPAPKPKPSATKKPTPSPKPPATPTPTPAADADEAPADDTPSAGDSSSDSSSSDDSMSGMDGM